MGVRKVYEPHCPARDCTGGHSNRLYSVLPSVEREIPSDVLKRKSDRMRSLQCGYCGFVWFQSSSAKPGFEAIPAGWWDNFRWPCVFQPVPLSYEIREQNTRAYWDAYEDKLRKRRKGTRRRFF